MHVKVTSDQDESLVCKNCENAYPVVAGVVRTVKQENYADTFGFQWNLHRQTQLDSHTGLTMTRDRLVAATGWKESLIGQRILEAGSGAGRFTEVLASTEADIYSFDLSGAVDANFASNSRFGNVNFFQADIYDPPFVLRSFDHVVCLGVIQHTPDPEGAFRSLVRFVKPGGTLVIDCYAKNLRSLLSWKYVLRPFTKRMTPAKLYALIETVAPPLVPVSAALRRLFGAAGARLIPILQYEHWGLPPGLNRSWAVLDTFDMYSPRYDNPQTLSNVRRWYGTVGFESVTVRYGLNGVVASGRRPTIAT
jgi:2-polyprenyl-3-methyl-5-hydroxy-6-metoxy-1,4-benzoquinol methylase